MFDCRVMGRNPRVRGDPPAPAPTVLWAVTVATRRPAHLRPTADKVRHHSSVLTPDIYLFLGTLRSFGPQCHIPAYLTLVF